MKKLTADYIFPVSDKPVKNGVLVVNEDGKIIELVKPEFIDYEISELEKFNGIICPGLINTHCHLELSYMKSKIHPRTGLSNFIVNLEKIKREPISEKEISEAIKEADIEMKNNGIVAVGDISNTMITSVIKRDSKIRYHNFIEVFASNPLNAETVFENAKQMFDKFSDSGNCSIVPHSAYSVSEKLFQLISKFAGENKSILCLHHQENEDENHYFSDKSGAIAERAKLLNIDISLFNPTGKNPVESISKYLPAGNNVQLVHNTVTSQEDIDFAEANIDRLWWCLCPGSNFYIEGMIPDALLFYANKCKINIGTDSLASNTKLSVLEEIKKIGRVFPEIKLESLIEWATINGAEFMKIDNEFGSFSKGKKPGINLISNIDLENLKLTKESTIKPILF